MIAIETSDLPPGFISPWFIGRRPVSSGIVACLFTVAYDSRLCGGASGCKTRGGGQREEVKAYAEEEGMGRYTRPLTDASGVSDTKPRSCLLTPGRGQIVIPEGSIEDEGREVWG